MRASSLITIAAVSAALALPAGAAAQGSATNPFAPGLPQSTPSLPSTSALPPVAAPVTTTSTSSGGSLSGGSAVAIGVGAMIVLGGIAAFIWYDARRRAPLRHRAAEAAAGGVGGSKPRPKPRKLSPAERRRRKRGRAR